MFDIPETLIIVLSAVLLVLWTRHWLLYHQVERKTPKNSPQALPDEFSTARQK